MADPVTAGLIITAATAAVSTAMAGVSASSQASAQSKAAEYNAEALKQSGVAASNTAAANEATSLRRSSADLGEQAAAFGEANIGTGGSVAQVEKQSRTFAQEDALNIWYGGVLEKHQADQAANLERYNSLVDKRAADSALIGGAVGAGTALLTGGTKYGVYKSGGATALKNFNVGFGSA